MSEQTTDRTCRTTYKEKLRPTPAQERALEQVLWHCRTLYNTALEQRITTWQRCHVSLTRSQQEAELKEIRAEFPDYAATHSHVLQDVLARLDRTYQAFFRRRAAGKRAGFPRCQGRTRYHSFTDKEYGNGVRLENGALVLSTIGRIAVRWSRPVAGSIKTVTIAREADGWYICCSCAQVPTESLPLTGKETGIDVGLQVFLITAEGDAVENPRHYRKAERALKKAQQRVTRRKKGSTRRRKAVRVLAKRHQHVRRQRRDFHHQTALALVRTTPSPSRPFNLPTSAAVLRPSRTSTVPMSTLGPARKPVSTRAFRTLGGDSFSSSSPPRQHAPVREWTRSTQRTPRRTAAAVASACSSPCVCAPMSARTAG
jgi:putative transposase